MSEEKIFPKRRFVNVPEYSDGRDLNSGVAARKKTNMRTIDHVGSPSYEKSYSGGDIVLFGGNNT